MATLITKPAKQDIPPPPPSIGPQPARRYSTSPLAEATPRHNWRRSLIDTFSSSAWLLLINIAAQTMDSAAHGSVRYGQPHRKRGTIHVVRGATELQLP